MIFIKKIRLQLDIVNRRNPLGKEPELIFCSWSLNAAVILLEEYTKESGLFLFVVLM